MAKYGWKQELAEKTPMAARAGKQGTSSENGADSKGDEEEEAQKAERIEMRRKIE